MITEAFNPLNEDCGRAQWRETMNEVGTRWVDMQINDERE